MSAPIPVFGDRPKAVPTPKLRALVKFPGNIVGTTGIAVTKANGTATFETNWNDFGSTSALPTSPSSFILTFDTVTQAYVLVPSHLLGGAVSGIADVTVPGTFARQIDNWVETASKVNIDAADALRVLKSGDTMTGRLTISMPTSLLVLDCGGSASEGSVIGFKRIGLNRWSINGIDAVSEDGGNTGSPFRLYRYDDAGNFIDIALEINRANGRVKLNGDPILALHAATKQYVDAATASTGSTFGGTVFYATDYGVVADGSTNNATALQNLFTAAAASATAAVWFPAGIIKSSTSITATVASNSHISFHGQGSESTIINFFNATNGLVFNFANPKNGSISIAGMTLQTGGHGDGSAVIMQYLAGLVADPANTPNNNIYDVVTRGNDGFNASCYWANGFHVVNVSNLNWTCCGFYGGSNGIGINAEGLGSSVSYSVVYNVNQCLFEGLDTGFFYSSFVQGVTISQCNMTGVNFGVRVPPGTGGALNQLGIFNSQFAGIQFVTIGSNTMGQMFLIGNYIGCSGIAVVGSFAESSIIGNWIQGDPASTAIGLFNCITMSIHANLITSWANGITLDAGTSGVNILGNSYNGVATHTINSGSGNSIGVATD